MKIINGEIVFLGFVPGYFNKFFTYYPGYILDRCIAMQGTSFDGLVKNR